MGVLVLGLIVVALILAAVELFRSQGQSLIAWAVAAIAVALLVPQIAGA
jgi:hypothetical protein